MNAFKFVSRIWLFSLVFSGNIFGQRNSNAQTDSIPYNWKNVRFVGGGFVDGIEFHPSEKGLVYCRTDMGGAYRRDAGSSIWIPMLDWVSYKDRNLMGVESIALDPSDPDKLYLACGTYTNPAAPYGAVLRSNDRGKTFKRTDLPFKMGGNEDGRGNGERMAVDPLNGKILFLGTRHAGLWKSTDAAVTWQQVEGFPDPAQSSPPGMKDQDSIGRWLRQNRGSGIIFVIFDSGKSPSANASQVVYAGISRVNMSNLYRSSDGGEHWEPVAGQPVKHRPTHAALSADGLLYITYGDMPGPSGMTDGAVWKYNTRSGEWINITPDKPDPMHRAFGYASVSVDRQNTNNVIVSTYNRYKVDNGEDIFRSTDGGKTWKQVFKAGGRIDSRLAPYTAHTGIHWLFDIEIDPFDANHAIFTTGYGGHETFNLTDNDRDLPTTWGIMSTGIEETVPLELLSPPKGAWVITAIGDYGGAVHWDLDKPSPEGNFSNPRFGNTNGIACGLKEPQIIVRVGRATNDNPGKTIGYSTDSGRSWSPCIQLPHVQAALGDIAVSAHGDRWIWSPDPVYEGFGPGRKANILPVYLTTDQGKTWRECGGIPGNTRVIADAVNNEKFYAIDLFGGTYYCSIDGGVNFLAYPLELPNGVPVSRINRGDSRGGQDRIYATPGIEEDLWIAAFDGLYHRVSGKWLSIKGVEEMHAFGFGKKAPIALYPTLFMVGKINGLHGIFRSTNKGETWQRINDDNHEWGLLLHITGDPKKFGRVYVGTHGRGTIYGDEY